MHATARAYAEAGIPVFPCVPGTKTPATAHGFHDATADLAQIDAWWTEQPDYNIAFTPHSMGWGVVDIDSREAEEEYIQACDEAEEAWQTWTVRTPRGGLHLYYLGELPTSVGTRVIPGQKIDTRGRGSYALLPPSRTADGTYETVRDVDVAPLPEWVAQAIQATAHGGGIVTSAVVDEDLPANVDRATRFLKDQSPAIEGQMGNAHTYATAAALHNLGLSPEKALELLEEHFNPRCVPPWDHGDLETLVTNAYRYAQNSPGIHAATSAAEAFGPALANLPPDDPYTGTGRSRFWPEDEAEQEEGKEPTWLIKDLLPDQATVMLYGPTQNFKSFVALDLALSTAARIGTFAGEPTRTGPVFYAALEGRTELKKARRRSWKLARQVDVVPNFYVMPAPLLFSDDECAQFITAIRERLDGRHCAGIYLDTIAKVMSGLNENDARDAGRMVRFMDDLKEEFRCPIIGIHHTGRDESHDRGSSSFRAGVDTVIRVSAHRPSRMLKIEVEKHKDAQEPEVPWYLQGRQIGQSLTFQTVSRDEYLTATRAESLFTHGKVGGALKALGSYGDSKAVTTHVLAAKLLPPEEGEDPEVRERKLTSTVKALAKLAKDNLLGYVTGQGKDLLWSLPEKD